MHYWTLTALAQAIRAREVSPVEVTEMMLERIARLDGRLHSYAEVLGESALEQAKAAEFEIRAGQYRGPLHGIPVAVKDLCAITGVATRGGCAVLADHVPDFDSTVVARFNAAGAVMLGKLNLTEGAMAGYNPAFEVPQNPWREGYWAGASSSGSGAATAAGLAYATLGSDTGGSIRHPAAVCGTVGLKPTWGRVSRYGVLDLAQSLDHVGPLTRSTADAAIVLQAIGGADPKDPTSLSEPMPDFLAEAEAGIAGMRVGWDEGYATRDLAPDFAEKVEQAVRTLESLGARIIPVKMPSRLREYLEAWQVLCSSEAYVAHSAFYPERANDYGPWFREWLRRGSLYSGRDYAAAHQMRLACSGELHAMLRDVDVFACPSTAREAFPNPPELAYAPIPEDRDSWHSRYTVPMDYAGVPTLSLPCGLSESGLPLSLQIVAGLRDEASLVRAGCAFERATPWHNATPPGWD